MALLLLTLSGIVVGANAIDWSTPEQQLARKITAVTGSGIVSVWFENRSSLGRRDAEIVENGLRSALESTGARITRSEQPSIVVKISLSENLNSYVWVAEVRRGENEPAVLIVSTPRPERSAGATDSVPLTLRKISLWKQVEPILDVAVLEEGGGPTRIAVLGPEKLSLYRTQNGRWQEEQSVAIIHSQPWPRDLRGRLILASDHLLDIYLPGIACRSSASPPFSLSCSDSDDPWPLTFFGSSASRGSQEATPTLSNVRAFFSPTRNFFTGVLTPAIGKFTNVPKFYSAAMWSREKSQLWLFTATDGSVHVIDGTSDQPLRLPWGSDLASIKTACGAGWQLLATSSDPEAGDSVKAFEIPDRDPVPVSGRVDFPGPITALWTETRGETAIAVARDPVNGSYEAFRLAVACNQ